MSEPTPAEREILAHSLGMKDGNKRPYRNHFAAGPMHSDMPKIRNLIAAGLMEQGATRPSIYGDMTFYHVTEAGCALLGITRAEAER